MSVTSSQNDGEQNSEFTPKEANNFIRGNKGGCLLITKGGDAEIAFITVNRTYFRVQEFGKPAKVERHTMSTALRNARKNSGAEVRLAAYQQSSLDIESAVEFIRDTFELEDKESKAGFGLGRDELDEAGDEHLEIAAGPAEDRNDENW